jgi:RecB family exonuclease
MSNRGGDRAVVDGELLKVSASQITTFARCGRRWWFEKVLGERQESTGAQNLGTAIHSQMEAWIQEGTLPPHPGAFAATKLRRDDGTLVLPAPKTPGVLVEAALEEPEIYADGVRYRGFIDLTIPGKQIEIIDYKSCRSFSYIKTPEQLRKDVQVGSYGFWAHKRFPEAESLRVSHVYILSRGKSARVVEAQATWDDVNAVWEVIRAAVRDMRRTAKIKDFRDVEPNFDACSDYGGCPYASKCTPVSDVLDTWEPSAEELWTKETDDES